MEIGEAHSLEVEPIELRRLDDLVAVAGEVAIALVVGHDKHDIRPGLAGVASRGDRTTRGPNRRHTGRSQEVSSIHTHGPLRKWGLARAQVRRPSTCLYPFSYG